MNCDKPYLTGLGVWGLAIDGGVRKEFLVGSVLSFSKETCHIGFVP